jgi:hypothetical protein
MLSRRDLDRDSLQLNVARRDNRADRNRPLSFQAPDGSQNAPDFLVLRAQAERTR